MEAHAIPWEAKTRYGETQASPWEAKGQANGWIEGWTDRWKDKNSPCVLQDFIPFGAAALLPFIKKVKQGKGIVEMQTIFCIWVTR